MLQKSWHESSHRSGSFSAASPNHVGKARSYTQPQAITATGICTGTTVVDVESFSIELFEDLLADFKSDTSKTVVDILNSDNSDTYLDVDDPGFPELYHFTQELGLLDNLFPRSDDSRVVDDGIDPKGQSQIFS